MSVGHRSPEMVPQSTNPCCGHGVFNVVADAILVNPFTAPPAAPGDVVAGGPAQDDGTNAGVKSWKGVETTSVLQAQNHGQVMEMQCLQAPSVFGLRVNTPGEHVVVHLKKAAAAALGRRRLF